MYVSPLYCDYLSRSSDDYYMLASHACREMNQQMSTGTREIAAASSHHLRLG